MKPASFVGILTLQIALLMCVVPGAGVLGRESRMGQKPSRSESIAANPAIRTDKESYLAGEYITISGKGFSPFETVMLHVEHANGTMETGMGHDPWWVYTDADGTFKTTWSLNPQDTAGVNFVLEAAGASGPRTQARFVRRGAITIDRFDGHGERMRIKAVGFGPNELVTVVLNDGHGHAPVTALSDENGQVTADLDLLPDEPGASALIVATSHDSLLTASLAISPIPANFFAVKDQQGANDQPGQKDLTQMGRDESDPYYYKLFWSWDETAAWTGSGNTGDACALFDSDGDGNINFAVCGQITNPGGNPNLVNQTALSTRPYSCNNTKSDRCPKAAALTFTPTDVLAGQFLTLASGTSNLITATDPFPAGASNPNDSTLQVNIRKGFLPANSVLVNVCSYPAGPDSSAGDCILSPGGGYLVVVKDAGADTTTPFQFTVNPVPSQLSSLTIIGTGQSDSIGLAIGTNSESVTEAVPAGWQLDNASCTLQDGSPTGSLSGSAVGGITIQSGKVTTCTFKNSLQIPHIKVVKSLDRYTDADGSGTITRGDTLFYKFVVTNDGQATLNPVSVTDALFPLGISCPGVASLAPIVSMTCTTTSGHVVTPAEADAGAVINTVNVSGTPPVGVNVNATDTLTTPVIQNPHIKVVKSLDHYTDTDTSGTITRGDTLFYKFVVTNDGNVTLNSVSVTDASFALGISCPGTSLAPNASMTCTTTSGHVVTSAEANAAQVGNTVNVSGKPPVGANVNATDTLTTTIVQNPHIKVVKSLDHYTDGDGSGTITRGDTLFYKFVVTNDGDVTLNPVSVTDATFALEISCPGASLAPNASMTCTTTSGHAVSLAEADAAKVVNTVNVSGKPPVGANVNATDTLTTTILQNAHIKVLKSLDHYTDTDGSGTITRGDTLLYKFVVTNDGNVTLNPVSVTDATFALGISCPGASLAPSASITCTTTSGHVVTLAEGDAAAVINTVNVSGTPPVGANVNASDTLTTPVIQNPHMKVVKSIDRYTDADGSGTITRGDTLFYKFVVTNDGNVTLNPVSVTDASFTLGISCPGTSLAPSASMSCTTTSGHVVALAEGDAGKVVNTVSVSGKPPVGANVNASDTLTTPVIQNPHIKVVKSIDRYTDADGSGTITRGDTLFYKFGVTNDGNVTLNPVSVTDASFTLGISCPGTSLAPSASMTCTTTSGHVVTLAEADAAKVVNTVNVSGKPPVGADVAGTDTLTTPIARNPHLTYDLKVTSDGNVTAQNVSTSDLSNLIWICTPTPPTALAPGGTMTCTASKIPN